MIEIWRTYALGDSQDRRHLFQEAIQFAKNVTCRLLKKMHFLHPHQFLVTWKYSRWNWSTLLLNSAFTYINASQIFFKDYQKFDIYSHYHLNFPSAYTTSRFELVKPALFVWIEGKKKKCFFLTSNLAQGHNVTEPECGSNSLQQ